MKYLDLAVSLRIAHRDGYGALAALLDRAHERRAAVVVEVLDLAVEALETFGRVDLARRLDRADRAARSQQSGTGCRIRDGA